MQRSERGLVPVSARLQATPAKGAAIGAASGGALGIIGGAGGAPFAQESLQQQYDIMYGQCMAAHGNSVESFSPPPAPHPIPETPRPILAAARLIRAPSALSERTVILFRRPIPAICRLVAVRRRLRADPRILALALQCVESRVRSGLAVGHEGEFAPPRLSGRSAFSEETFVGRCGQCLPMLPSWAVYYQPGQQKECQHG